MENNLPKIVLTDVHTNQKGDIIGTVVIPKELQDDLLLSSPRGYPSVGYTVSLDAGHDDTEETSTLED